MMMDALSLLSLGPGQENTVTDVLTQWLACDTLQQQNGENVWNIFIMRKSQDIGKQV